MRSKRKKAKAECILKLADPRLAPRVGHRGASLCEWRCKARGLLLFALPPPPFLDVLIETRKGSVSV